MGDDGCVAAGATAKALGSRMGRDPARRLGSFLLSSAVAKVERVSV